MTTPEAEKMAKEIISKHALSRIGTYSIDVIRTLAAEAYTLGHESGRREMAKEAWQPIETLNRTEMQFVLVTEDGMVRTQLWNPIRWESGMSDPATWRNPDCPNPTHWMPLPEVPSRAAEFVKKNQEKEG